MLDGDFSSNGLYQMVETIIINIIIGFKLPTDPVYTSPLSTSLNHVPWFNEVDRGKVYSRESGP